MKELKRIVSLMCLMALITILSGVTVFATMPEDDGTRSYPEHSVEHHGNHYVYKNGYPIGYIKDNVYGVYSQADGYAIINFINYSLNVSDNSYYAYTYYSGTSNNGCIKIFSGGSVKMSIYYTIHTNGYIEETVVYHVK